MFVRAFSVWNDFVVYFCSTSQTSSYRCFLLLHIAFRSRWIMMQLPNAFFGRGKMNSNCLRFLKRPMFLLWVARDSIAAFFCLSTKDGLNIVCAWGRKHNDSLDFTPCASCPFGYNICTSQWGSTDTDLRFVNWAVRRLVLIWQGTRARPIYWSPRYCHCALCMWCVNAELENIFLAPMCWFR